MAVKDLRASVTSRIKTGAGKRTVQYIDAKGRTFNAWVLAAGTSSGLKLYISSYVPGFQIKDNVPAQTSVNSTVCYHAR